MFDFDQLTDRRNSYSTKWNVDESELPMWVADMDFETAPVVKQAILQRAEQGIFGYSDIPDEFRSAVKNWWEMRHNIHLQNEWILFAIGVIPAISSMVRKLTTVGENIVIQPPVYNIFYNSILNNGRNVLENPLIYAKGEYRIDFDDLETKLADPQTTLMILCNPHNPIGKIWDYDTLLRVGELCSKYNVIVISDEIHCDLTSPATQYMPFASLPDTYAQNSISCVSAGKAFNLAGLQSAAIIVPNPLLRHKVNRGLNTDEVAEPNAFAIQANIAAFTEGEPWLNALNRYLENNKIFARQYFDENLPQIYCVPSEATYLLWLDCTKFCSSSSQLADFIRKETGLYLSAGSIYGKNGEGFLRLNIATQRSRLEDGLIRLKHGIENFNQNGASHSNRY